MYVPIQRSAIRSHQPCESCQVRRSTNRLVIPGGPTMRVCDRCVEAVTHR